MKKKVEKIVLIFILMMLAIGVAAKEKNGKQDEAKALSGISIVGNKEAPNSLFIVPWKSSEMGFETGLSSSLLNEKLQAVDKDVFERELDFYTISVGK